MKLQDLPVAFFNQNKAGDLISRVNNDTDKLNQFVAQALMQFLGSIFLMTGAAVFALSLNFRLGLAALLPAVGVLAVTKATSAWVKARNMRSLQSLGGMSSEVQESLQNFKVIVAFNRMDYFQRKFETANEANYAASVSAGYRQQHVHAHVRPGPPLGAAIGGGLRDCAHRRGTDHRRPVDRVSALRQQLLRSHAAAGHGVVVVPACAGGAGPDLGSAGARIGYAAGERRSGGIGRRARVPQRVLPISRTARKDVLRDVSFELEKGKAYALVGPTGGGKTTTASLMARLYDPTEGSVFLDGRDIRSVAPDERSRKVGFIPQEPFLFSGTVRDNIVYGNDEYRDYSSEQLAEVLEEANLSSLMARFSEGLDTKVASSGNSISLGQKQLIAFMRATLRRPELLILDEATANIDTVTEQLLEEILNKLPPETTKVIIAHRLNTIDNVDQIFFVNSGGVALAGSMEHAVDMLLHGKRES